MTRSLAHPATSPTTGLRLRKVGHNLGAIVDDIRLGPDLDDDTVAALNSALNTHEVLFFRGQHHLDDDGQYEFAQRLGVPTAAHPTVLSHGGRLLPIEGAANSWHTDVTFVDRVPKASILRAIELPAYGGSTLWASTTSAYDALPAPLRAFADTLRAVHSNDYDYADQHRYWSDPKAHAEFIRDTYEVEHPAVRVHPETGRPSLLLGHFVKRFAGLRSTETGPVLELFQSRITRPDNTVRWDWQLGDVAIWDNRSTQHYGVHDYGDQPRRLNRVTLAGDVPVDLRGASSTVISGDASHYSPIVAP